MIFPGKPSDWQDLEKKVCQIFTEAGCLAGRNQTLKTVRGPVDIDVLVRDKTRRPHSLMLCECKHWNRRVPKTVVHAFRTVVQDSGANLGFIISDGGFQAGSYEAAKKANIKLVTWKEFQAEMHERWFRALERRLVLLCDSIVEISDADIGADTCQTLASEAINGGGETVWNEFDRLNGRYAELTFASSCMLGRAPRRFPHRGIDPRAATPRTMIVFKSARMYFDILLETAPQAFADYVAFLLKHTGGRCGSQQLFDDAIIGQIEEGKTTTAHARSLFGHTGGIQRVPYDGEVWTFRGSHTRFKMPMASGTAGEIGSTLTVERTLTIDFGPDEIARRVSVRDVKYARPPRL
jgi:hypothetical protein